MSLADPDAQDQFQLREYLAILRLRKWSVIVVAGLTLALGLFMSFRQTPIYRSMARVLVKPPSNPSQVQLTVPSALLNLETEREVARSENVAALAAERLGGEDPRRLLGRVTVNVPPNAAILEVGFAHPSPLEAQEGANAFAQAYLDYKTTQTEEAVEALRAPLLEQIAEFTQQLRQLDRRISPVDGPTPSQQSRRDELSSQLTVLRTQIAPLNAIVIDPGDVIQSASLPSTPASPNHTTNGILALFVGLVLGVILAFVRERLDDRLRGRSDLEAQSGAPVLAVIPKLPGWKKKDDARLVTVEEPKSSVAEAYRTLRTSMLFAAAQRDVKSVLITSTSAGEGKTTTAANLSVVLAHADKRVILVSADLRKPRVHRFFGLSNKNGLVNVLAGEQQPWEALLDPGIDNLRIFPSGPVPSRPAELLGSEAMGALLEDLREVADFIVIDTAPLLVVSDALALAPLVDGALLVADANATHRAAVAHGREQLEQVGAQVLGSVLNNFDPSKARAYPYYYRYYYRYRYRYGYRQPYSAYGSEPALEEEPSRQTGSSI